MAATYLSDEIVCGSKHHHVTAHNSRSRYMAASVAAGHDPIADLDRPSPRQNAASAADSGPGAIKTHRCAGLGARSRGLAWHGGLGVARRDRRWAAATTASW